MKDGIKLLDIIALIADMEELGLVKGQVGTVVKILGNGVLK